MSLSLTSKELRFITSQSADSIPFFFVLNKAHVRGHQVRKNYKNYKKIVWSVMVVEKAVLRWRRKGSGLRGFRSEGLIEGPSGQNQPSNEDDYDFLKEGRKQTEVRLDKALARVKSMVQYPEARDQYRRLLNVVSELQESKVMAYFTGNMNFNFTYRKQYSRLLKSDLLVW